MVHDLKVLTYKGRVVFEKMAMSYFQRIPKLFQKNEACFMFITKGEFSIRTPDQFLPFKEKQGMLAKCFNYFFETNEIQRKSSDNLQLIGVMLYPSMIEELFQFDLSSSNHTVDFNVKQVEIDGLLENFRASIDILLDHPELADDIMIETKLKEFVLLINKTQGATSELDFLSAIFKTNVTEFKATINNNIYSTLSTEEFAKLCNMSLSSFKRRFKETYGQSPKKYILKMKLGKAAKILSSVDNRINDVAYDCGFESLATFNRNFKKEYGTSPTAFRQGAIGPN